VVEEESKTPPSFVTGSGASGGNHLILGLIIVKNIIF